MKYQNFWNFGQFWSKNGQKRKNAIYSKTRLNFFRDNHKCQNHEIWQEYKEKYCLKKYLNTFLIFGFFCLFWPFLSKNNEIFDKNGQKWQKNPKMKKVLRCFFRQYFSSYSCQISWFFHLQLSLKIQTRFWINLIFMFLVIFDQNWPKFQKL